VEWYQVRFSRSDESFTFEVILYENGDIVFQYGLMQYSPSGWSCGSAGIEDSFGLDGLNYLPFCQKAPSNKAVRFYRPSPSARVTIRPRYQGRFTHAGAVETFQVPIRNTGELGGDTYDISVSSPWTMSLYGEDGSTTLADTDGDGVVDTGLVAQGSTFTVTAKVQIPPAVNTGDENFATLTVSSSIDTGKSKTTTLQTAVPAPFAQVYADDADGAMSLYLVQPGAQAVKKASGNWYYGYIPAVAEMPNGNFVLAWVKYRSVSNVSVTEIEYAIMDRYGNVVRSPTRLTDHSGATIYTYDYSPVVAVAPNGHIGVLWYRYLRDQNTYKQNYNIYFAILDPVGNRVYGPVNLTNNSAWGTGPFFSYPRITATGDNRFVLAWYREHSEGSGWVEDIYYTIRDTNGNLVKDITRFTAGQAGGPYFYYPALASLSNNRVLLAYTRNDETRYAVLDSAGNTVKQETSLGYGYRPDAVQLSDGKIVVAWTRWINNRGFIQFAVLDGSTYTWTAGPITLSNPAAPAGEDFVSVAATTAGAVLTWMDESWSSLYYALVDSNGNILTPPMIFRMAGAVSWGSPTIETSYEGYGNTSYTWNPAKNVDAWVQAPGLAGAPPGGVGAAAVRYGNYGMTTATSGVLTATLDGALTYWNANPMPNSVNGSEVVWNLPDLSFLDQGQVLLWVRVPEAEIGTRYPVTWTLTSAGSESNPNDNTAATQVMVARQVFLSLVLRSYP
ncbi:MAG: hypothetical protein H5T61_15420, partial [Thermoflexales bacterium]|nr:hypothetical protein [Thermoflexales bacterium]